MQIIVEGWRFIPHSYSIVSQRLCLELLRHPEIKLWHRDAVYLDTHWQPLTNLFDSSEEADLAAIPTAAADQNADVTLRIAYPYNLGAGTTPRTFVLATAECNIVPEERVSGGSLSQITPAQKIRLITLSQWSKAGLVQSGVDPSCIAVVPCGVDVSVFKPLPEVERQQLRQELGWEGFVFLNTGAMIPSKGVDRLVRGFAALVERHPEARLVLKGVDFVYPEADERIGEILLELDPAQAEKVLERLTYVGDSLSFAEMARLYQASDAYVSPYLAEGFNLPVLEAIACGLPVICTQGGSTDDFTTPDFALKIVSQPLPVTVGSRKQAGWVLIPDPDHLIHLMEQVMQQPEFRAKARVVGPQFVNQHYTWRQVGDQLLQVLTAQD